MSETPAPKPRLKLDVAIPLALFVLALAIRLVGIGWGLRNDLHDHSYHPDEDVVLAYSQAIEPSKGKFTPGFYNYGTLYLTLLRVAGDATATYTGAPDPRQPETVAAFAARAELAGRLLSALAGALTSLLAFLILRRWTSLVGAGAAGLLIALAPAHTVHSRFQTVDVLAACLGAASLYFALRLIPVGEEPRAPKPEKLAALAGLFAGLSAGTKYTGILLVFSLGVALWLGRDPKWARQLGIGLAVAAAAFVVATPGVLLDQAKFLRDFTFEMRHTSTGHDILFLGTSTGFVYHLGNLMVGIGPTLALLGLGGLGVAAYRRQPWAWVLLAFVLPYYLLIGRAEVKFLRYTFPLYIGVAAGFGWAMGRAHERKDWGRVVAGLGILGLGGLDGGGLRGATSFAQFMANEDPRDQAARYLRKATESVPEATVGLASDPWYYTVPLFKESASPRWVPLADRLALMREGSKPPAVFHVPSEGEPFAFDVRLLTEDRPLFVAYSSFESGDLERIRDMKGLDSIAQLRLDRYKAFTDRLKQDYRLERVFGALRLPVHDLEYVQPTIYLWKRKTT